MEKLNSKQIKIVQAENLQQLSQKTLELFVDSVSQTLKKQNVFYLAISGGRTPADFYKLLGTDRRSLDLPWSRIELFWVDERCVGPDSPDSNFKLAADTFLNAVAIPKQNIHRIAGEYPDYLQTVQEYTETLQRVFKIEEWEVPAFDLTILGMGPDGHIGSLLPDSYDFDRNTLVSEVYHKTGGYNRITLTHPVICNSQKILVLVSGSEKAEMLKTAFTTKPNEIKYPVHTLWPFLKKVVWLIDSDAAKELSN
ncbi:MAG: 6-phosphogluconolactonase [Planctomycetaceae bacterium]|nr:6-phosphogluconolactonase [Planctomycetaceae bacterium]